MTATSIEWADRVRNPVTGCEKSAQGDRKGADPEEWPDDLRVRETV